MTDIIAPTSVSLQATHTLPTDHSTNNSAPKQRRQRPPQQQQKQQQQQQQADGSGSSEKKTNTRRRRPNRNEGTSSNQSQNARIDNEQTTTETSVSTPTPEQKTRRQGNRRSNGSSSNKNSNSNGTSSGPANPGQSTGGQTRNGNRLNGRKFQAGLTPQESDEPVSEVSQQKKPSQQHRAPAKFVPKIEADRDLLTSLTVGLTSSKYECMVCFDVIRPAHKIWNCQVCWAAFHLDCLSTWAKKSVGESSSSASGWRCPGCQHVQVSIPKDYNCFCGKVQNPEFNRYFTPHSCGELCGRSRDCSHSCNLPCHPGPCPPCGGLGPIQYCHCGSESFQLRCADTDFSFTTGKSCNKICEELLGCGTHTCASACHPGLCPPCDENQEQSCYCGKHTQTAKCGEGVARTTVVDGEEKLGYYECTDVCDRLLACGNHRCTKDCHVHDREPGPCPALPENVKTCPCGSKTVDSLLDGKLRTSCLDPIPVCGNICQKILDCGHSCTKKCHRGKCGPCKETILVDCRCGSTHVQRVCSEMSMHGNSIPTCEKLCRGLRSCGKHQCTNRCCPAKNPSKSGKVDLATHEAHACTLVCGKKLKCGVHTCEMPCHKGHCDPCMNASFDDLSCSCGKTVMLSPIPCGTTIPKCRYTCTRNRECGHASLTSHPCHPDSEPCPPCIMLVPKQCMCRRSLMPNVPCYKSNPSCGKICGKRLDCDHHKCVKSCHSGECLAPGTESCIQPCPKPRKSCGHRCSVACHGQEACNEDQPCPVIVPSSCKCGTLTKETACNATKENPYDGKPRIIKCNDYCLIAERNKRVAIALDIDESARSGPRIPEYADHILDFVLANMEFTLKLEKQLADWVADESKPILYLQPMKGPRRKFTHELAAHYNVMSESVDVEPYRSVTIRRKLNTSVPGLLASQACRQKRSSGQVLSSGVGVEQLRKSAVKEPVNAIYLHELVFGLTRLELAEQLVPVFGSVKYGLRWLTDDDAVLIPHQGSLQMDEFESLLMSLRSGIKTVASMGKLCDRVELCWVNKEGEVVSQTANSSKRFFTVQQGNQWNKKLEPAKMANAFALLDDDERVAAAKKAEEERVLKAKEAAGTLSLAAWEEAASSRPSSAEGVRRSTPPLAPTRTQVKSSPSSFGKYVPGAFTNRRPQEVVDDWEQLLESEDDNDDY